MKHVGLPRALSYLARRHNGQLNERLIVDDILTYFAIMRHILQRLSNIIRVGVSRRAHYSNLTDGLQLLKLLYFESDVGQHLDESRTH